MNSLRTIRKNKYTQSELAKKIGITQQQYSKIENNPEKCPILIAVKIAEELGESVYIFLNKNTPK